MMECPTDPSTSIAAHSGGRGVGHVLAIAVAAAIFAAASVSVPGSHAADRPMGWQTVTTDGRFAAEPPPAPLPDRVDRTVEPAPVTLAVRDDIGEPVASLDTGAPHETGQQSAPHSAATGAAQSRRHATTAIAFSPHDLTLLGIAGLVALSMLRDLVAALLLPAVAVRQTRPVSRPGPRVDDRQLCVELLDKTASLWMFADAAVTRLDASSPLRALLIDELGQVRQRLVKLSGSDGGNERAIATSVPGEHLVLLRQRLRRTVRDLERIWATADAALATVGDAGNEPRVPQSRDEALLVLGASRDVDDQTLQRLVRALRQCWHPDLAQTEPDRSYRHARITQINVAYDILRGRRIEA